MTNKNQRIMQRDGPGLVQQISCKENFIIRPFFIEEEAIKRLNIYNKNCDKYIFKNHNNTLKKVKKAGWRRFDVNYHYQISIDVDYHCQIKKNFIC